MTTKLVTLAVLGAAALGLAASWKLMAQTAGRTIRDGVFTSAQAERGARVFEVARRHYDLGNEFYEAMLDRRMIYSCAYWEGAHTLDDAHANHGAHT